jgi:membrane protease YdiL (CAAX protease family)
MTQVNVESSWLRAKLIASWLEIIAVLFIVLGKAIYVSSLLALHGSNDSHGNILSNSSLVRDSIWQSAILALLLGFLRWRGWSSADFKIRPTWRSSLQGGLLLMISKIGYSLTLLSTVLVLYVLRKYITHDAIFGLPSVDVKIHQQAANWLILLIANIINAYYEELICMGYAFNQFAVKLGPYFALMLMVLLRTSYHTYQGVTYALPIGAVFFMFGICYWRVRNLWPLIFAHVLFDMFPMDLLKFVVNLFYHP